MKALVLSGGGSFGAYQAGACLALHEKGWAPDFVVGASIGAVNGFALSRSSELSELLPLWQELPHEFRSSGGAMSRLPLWGCVSLFRRCVRAIAGRYGSLGSTRGLTITMTEWPTCAIRAVGGPDVNESSLMASCALPGVLPPVRIDGRYYFDGGTFCRLPIRQALRKGATEIVAVDALAAHPSPSVRFFMRGATRLRNLLHHEETEPAREELRGVKLRRVQRPRRLGSVTQCFRWDRAWVESLIEAGYRDAQATDHP